MTSEQTRKTLTLLQESVLCRRGNAGGSRIVNMLSNAHQQGGAKQTGIVFTLCDSF